jgi:hypothetical protein
MKHIDADTADKEKALKAQNILLNLGFEKREGDNLIIYFRLKGWSYHINFWIRGTNGDYPFSWQAVSCGEKEGVNAIDRDSGEGLYKLSVNMPEELRLGGDEPRSKKHKSKSDMYRHLALRGGPADKGGDWKDFEKAVKELENILNMSVQESQEIQDKNSTKNTAENKNEFGQLALF